MRKFTSTFANDVWRRIGDYYDDGVGPKKIYVSRLKLKNKRRRLLNEIDVENVFASHGFSIIHPQELSFRKQVSLFRNADFIAGPAGSAMYNCAFQKKPRKTLILSSRKFFKLSDVLINTSTEGQMNYFIGETVDNLTPGVRADWLVDIKKLKNFLKDC